MDEPGDKTKRRKPLAYAPTESDVSDVADDDYTVPPSSATAPSSDAVQQANRFVTELSEGDTVGEYCVERLLGEGGMGRVYAAVHPVIGKKAAVKVLRAEFCTEVDSVERFIQEARAVNQIGHPNIVDIFAFGAMADGRSYLVMERLNGENLKQRIQRRKLSREELCHFGTSISRALSAAHKKNIVHRDLKPENIFLHTIAGERPIIKLLDFGIAKLMGNANPSAVERTRTGTMMGTPMYIAPEQARGHAIDHRVDIYSLGVMFFEFVAGRLPFQAENTLDLLVQHLMDAAPSLRSIDPGVPEVLDKLVLQMMAKDPNNRPSLSRVREVLKELRSLPEGDVAHTVPITLDEGFLENMAEYERAASVGEPAHAEKTSVPTVVEGLARRAPKQPSADSTAPVLRPDLASPSTSTRTRALLISITAIAIVAGVIAMIVASRSGAKTPPPPVVVAPAVVEPVATNPPIAVVAPPLAVAPTAAPIDATIAISLPANVRGVVFIDDVEQGVGDHWNVTVKPGEHHVRFTAAGYRDATQDVNTSAGSTQTIALAPQKIAAKKSIDTPIKKKNTKGVTTPHNPNAAKGYN